MREMSIKLVLISQLNSAHIHKQHSLPYQCNPAHIMHHSPIILRQIKVLQYLFGVQLPLCDCRGGQGIPTSCRLNFSSGHIHNVLGERKRMHMYIFIPTGIYYSLK